MQSYIKAIEEAEANGMLDASAYQEIRGYSGEMLLGALQRLTGLAADSENLCYLEVGVFRGLTLLSVAKANPSVSCFGVDKYQDHQGKFEESNFNAVHASAKGLGVGNATVITADYEEVLGCLEKHLEGRKVAVYFVDGAHDYRSQLTCLLFARPYLADKAVIVVDDCNYPHVRQATHDFLTSHPEYKLLFEAYTRCHPGNMDPEEMSRARQGWWNGVNILVHDLSHQLNPMYPPVDSDKSAFVESQNLQGMRFYGLAHQSLQLFDQCHRILNLHPKSLLTAWSVGLGLLATYLRGRKEFGRRYIYANQHTEELTTGRYAEVKATPRYARETPLS